ncbi:hypothetical protein [Mycobacterium sp. IDR2000157661]|uniref:hypothetical protein n=1 Tax=Mycobacterium sp. IDR2000157661 TaxID=2867005 RepID=UPI001EECB333|nr:hypothetical protein [Mycobacterium sp. IDR2000157661]ULE32517.1 hypothetical protein K3G64_20800 [Mycobacterium sp. IDR2000157661]
MRDRFGNNEHTGYTPMVERKPGVVRVGRHRVAYQGDGSEIIHDYVQAISCIGRLIRDDTSGTWQHDLRTPLGYSLPAQLDPVAAANLASQLHAAIPRIAELAALLEGRGRMTPLHTKVPLGPLPVSGFDGPAQIESIAPIFSREW